MPSRTTTAVIAAITSLALIPGVADARGHSKHHKQHRHHAHKVRVKTLHTAASITSQYADPTAPAPAGTVTVLSFTGGKLTLQHGDGTTSGRVTDKTRITCETAAPTAAPATTRSHGDDESGDASENGTPGTPSTTGSSKDHGDDDAGENEQESGDDDGQDGSGTSSCDQSALAQGAVVRRAKLEISGGTATFDEIELVAPAA